MIKLMFLGPVCVSLGYLAGSMRSMHRVGDLLDKLDRAKMLLRAQDMEF